MLQEEKLMAMENSTAIFPIIYILLFWVTILLILMVISCVKASFYNLPSAEDSVQYSVGSSPKLGPGFCPHSLLRISY